MLKNIWKKIKSKGTEKDHIAKLEETRFSSILLD